MLNDPVVEEVRRIREAYAKRFNYDIDAIARDLQRQQQESGHQLVRLPAKRISPASGHDATCEKDSRSEIT